MTVPELLRRSIPGHEPKVRVSLPVIASYRWDEPTHFGGMLESLEPTRIPGWWKARVRVKQGVYVELDLHEDEDYLTLLED